MWVMQAQLKGDPKLDRRREKKFIPTNLIFVIRPFGCKPAFSLRVTRDYVSTICSGAPAPARAAARMAVVNLSTKGTSAHRGIPMLFHGLYR